MIKLPSQKLKNYTMVLSKNRKAAVSAELETEVANSPLSIEGRVPKWLSGSLLRNGPIKVTVDGKSNLHWFDGLAMLHLFSFKNGEVHYTNRFLRSNAYDTVFREGSLKYGGFASDPCRSLFKRLFTLFSAPSKANNANVNVAKLSEQYVALTENPLPVKFDPQTLETLGVFDYEDELPKDKCWESAHPHYDVKSKETFNYLIEFGRNSYYVFYKLADDSTERKVIARIPVKEPAYMHSFALTENYVVFTEFPLVIKPLDLITKGKPFIQNFTWQPQRGTRFIVVDRHSGKQVLESFTKPFFGFHHANAYEKEGKIEIDIVTYNDANIITSDSLHIGSDEILESYSSPLERFSLSLKTGEIYFDVLSSENLEFPRINEIFDGRPHRYIYAAGFKGSAPNKEELLDSESLWKIDVETKKTGKWAEKNCSPGEPVFVPAPQANGEDDGVVLSVVIDRGQKDSFLLILDGKTFKEIGRARTPHLIPQGFHGQYFQS